MLRVGWWSRFITRGAKMVVIGNQIPDCTISTVRKYATIIIVCAVVAETVSIAVTQDVPAFVSNNFLTHFILPS